MTQTLERIPAIDTVSDAPAPLNSQASISAEDAQLVAYLYATALGRTEPFEKGGLNYWIDQSEAGLSDRRMAELFLDNPEFRGRFGDINTLSDEQIVDIFYQNVLGRPGDPAGREFWLGRLADPTVSVGDLLLAFASTPENTASLTFIETLREVSPGDWDFVDGPLPPVGLALVPGLPDVGVYGNLFEGATDEDGQATATFDLDRSSAIELRFDAFDVDSDEELTLIVNGEEVIKLRAAADRTVKSYAYSIEREYLNAGENTVVFQHSGPADDPWGITNVQLSIPDAVFTPTESRYETQWHFREIGWLERVWADYDGDGVHVAVYDDGFQYDGRDFRDNYDKDAHVVVGGQSIDPMDGDEMEHGTAVAGIITAKANNGGVVGIAHRSTVTGVDVLSDFSFFNDYFIPSLNQQTSFDVVNHSWGSVELFDTSFPVQDAAERATFDRAAKEGRVVNGTALGTITVKAAGNDGNLPFLGTVTAQGDASQSLRSIITVAASDSTGGLASYSSGGANVLVSAPSGGWGPRDLGIVTSDLRGRDGYADSGYTGLDQVTGFSGTSSSTPVVSGVAAVMLEANPNLGWRDVQTILAYTATHEGTKIGGPPPPAGPTGVPDERHEWRFNAADNWNGGGLHISEDYGFGDVDVFAAVRFAEVWSRFAAPRHSANEARLGPAGAPDLPIGTRLTVPIEVNAPRLTVETLQVSLTTTDMSLSIYLVSPEGTRVLLFDPLDRRGGLDWTFGVQLMKGEEASGTWKLDIRNPDGDGARLVDWQLEVFGDLDGETAGRGDDVYHYTDEIFDPIFWGGQSVTSHTSLLEQQPGRTTLADTDGGQDWLNLAAITGALEVDLRVGGSAASEGRVFAEIADGTILEHVAAGDNGDVLRGNAASNTLLGMRGDDLLEGFGAADRLEGGPGNDTLTGGPGEDIFVFQPRWGADVITDFDAEGNDRVRLEGFEFTSFDDLPIKETDEGLLLDFRNDGTLLFATPGLQLSEDDVVFV